MIIFWILIFILSLAVLVKSADWLVENAEKIGLALKIPPFIIGITIVALGTSFPELASSLIAVFKGATEIVAANAIGSGVANILLIVGLSAVVAKRLIVKRSLIDLDAPLLATTTILFLFVMWDKKIVFGEGVLLLLTFIIYLLYTIFQRRETEDETPELVEVLPSRIERRRKTEEIKEKEAVQEKLTFKVFLFLILGVLGLGIGAYYNIESVLKLSKILNISTSLIAITAMAVGTSLPDLIVSVRAAAKKKYEIALGNVFGSNIFIVLAVVGVPALFKPLKVDELTFTIGLPFLIVATLLFIISGISRRIHIWEGLMYLLLYILFIVKLIGLF
jgi:cation:H+ antiporter